MSYIPSLGAIALDTIYNYSLATLHVVLKKCFRADLQKLAIMLYSHRIMIISQYMLIGLDKAYDASAATIHVIKHNDNIIHRRTECFSWDKMFHTVIGMIPVIRFPDHIIFFFKHDKIPMVTCSREYSYKYNASGHVLINRLSRMGNYIVIRKVDLDHLCRFSDNLPIERFLITFV